MDDVRRVQRLRDLIAQLESLPASPERDRLLSEFRSRAVDVDTGVTPRAILPMREPAPAPRVDGRSVTRMAPPPPAPAHARPAAPPTHAENLDEPFGDAEWLSLDDSLPASPPPRGGSRGDRVVPPWTLGLRG